MTMNYVATRNLHSSASSIIVSTSSTDAGRTRPMLTLNAYSASTSSNCPCRKLFTCSPKLLSLTRCCSKSMGLSISLAKCLEQTKMVASKFGLVKTSLKIKLDSQPTLLTISPSRTLSLTLHN